MTQRSYGGRQFSSIATATIALALMAGPAAAQWSTAYEQFYLPAQHNWVFRDNYASADRLFNAFDYGHAILYETLYAKPDAPVSKLEVEEYRFLTEKLLRQPPRVPLEEGAIEIAYAKLAPEAKVMFEWAHLLHRQIYDVLADERLSQDEKDGEIAELLAYYKTRPDVAFSSEPKNMELMDGQFYSLAFREKYPKFNGLIWAYHWLQVGLYEPLMVNGDVASRTGGVNATVGRFWQMLENPPATMPYLMPMTGGVAPTFAARYPEAAIIFDNLHMMHDVVSDILTSPEVPRERKREEILRAAALFTDETSYVMSIDEWRMMSEMMGVNNMGGPAVGFFAPLPEPNVPRGMSMAGMEHGAMPGMAHGDSASMPGHEAMERDSAMTGMERDSAMTGMEREAAPMTGMQMDSTAVRRMMEMHMRMVQDPVIRERMASDSVIQQLMREMPEVMRMMRPGHAMPMGDTSMSGMDAEPSDAVRKQMLEFVVLLLSDPLVEARIHANPDLHGLWTDPEVQALLRELRQRNREPRPLDARTHEHEQR